MVLIPVLRLLLRARALLVFEKPSILSLSKLAVVARRWEESKPSDGTKWTYLEHKGPVFAPPYEPLPDEVKFKYNGNFIINLFVNPAQYKFSALFCPSTTNENKNLNWSGFMNTPNNNKILL